MIFAAFFIALLAIVCLLPLSFTAKLLIGEDGFDLEVSAILAYVKKLFKWNLKEDGLKLLKKDQPTHGKAKKKNRLRKILEEIFNPRSLLNIKRMRFLKLEVKGRIATHDAALTALSYGTVCSLIAVILPFVDAQRSQFDFMPDFEGSKPDFSAACIIKVRIIHIIYLIAEGVTDKYLKGRWHNLWNRILLKN